MCVNNSPLPPVWSDANQLPQRAPDEPLHDIVITNTVRCKAYKRGVGEAVVYSALGVQ